MLVFRSLAEAMRAGFEVYERIDCGYKVRTRTVNGFAFAIVDLGRS